MKRVWHIAVLVWGIVAAQQLNITPDTYLDNGKPVKRCATMEYEAWRRQQNPNLPSLEEFERWMQQKLVELRQQLATQNHGPVLYTIPVVVHVIHDGEPVGQGLNISQAQIQSQIDRLNEDFRRLNSDTVNTPAQFLPVAADIQIEFCLALYDPNGNPLPEPGIDRIDRNAMGWAAPPYTTNYIDNVIKPATIWDPYRYLNIWVTDIQNGILGYAQFPEGSNLSGLPTGAQNANTDGVVVRYTSFGDITKVNTPQLQAGAPYNMGRTTTHEVGHWLGLRHIWGDGPCGTDDFCADTPESDGPNFGCAQGHISCGTRDMVENYMDYSDDACMNLFTLDQRDRMWVVMQNSPRRKELPAAASTLCSSTPNILFATATTTTSETGNTAGVDCRDYTDLNIAVRITQEPSAAVSATLQLVPTSTARLGVDFDIINSVVSFVPGAGANQSGNFVIRIYDDASVEGTETIVLTFTISDPNIAGYGKPDTHVITINDDDFDPVPAGILTVFVENFETATPPNLPTGWTQAAIGGSNGVNDWMVGTDNPAFGNQSAYISQNDNQNTYDGGGLLGGGSPSDYLLISPWINAAGIGNLQLSFYYLCQGEAWNGTLYDYGALYYSLNGTNFFLIEGGTNPATNPYYNQPNFVRRQITLPAAVQGQNFQLGWRWVNDNSVTNNPPFNIDSVHVFSVGTIQVENVLSTVSEYLGPGDSAYFYNPATGKLMAKIVNLDPNHDYGCVNVQIDRAGTGAVDFQVVGAPATQKTFLVVPTNNNPTGVYRITLYYTAQEITGWENATGKPYTVLQVFKSNGAIQNVSPANPCANGCNETYANTTQIANFGSDWAFTGDFSTGFSGFALCDGCINTNPLSLQYFTATLQSNGDVLLQWQWNGNAQLFDIERSFDGKNFTKVGFVLPKQAQEAYQHIDAAVQQYNQPIAYYRLRVVDDKGAEHYSNVVAVRLPIQGTPVLQIYPVPVQETLFVDVLAAQGENVAVEVYDALGKRILYKEMEAQQSGIQHFTLPASEWSSGLYLVRVRSGQRWFEQKVMK